MREGLTTTDLVTAVKTMMADRAAHAERLVELDHALDATLSALADRVGVTETARLVGLSRKNVDKRVQRWRRGSA